MKISEKKFLYVWNHPTKGKDNVGKKVNSKTNYISSASSYEFWRDWSNSELDQYCIFESEDEDVISASEWWALDYGMKVRGKKNFYNTKNNAHRGDQSLVTPEIKEKIVAYFDGKLAPEKKKEVGSVGANIIHKVENGEYPVIQMPVYEIDEYNRNQVRSVTRNVVKEDDIIQRYLENPQRVKDSVTPMTVMVSKDGTKTIVNGHTRLGAALRCKNWNTLPVVFVEESEFGESEKEIAKNLIIAGSYANRESFVVAQENTEEDLIMQMTNLLAIAEIDIKVETARTFAREYLMQEMQETVPSRSKLAGLIKKLFNKLDKDQAEIEIQKNLKTYSDSELRKYAYDKYERDGIATVVSTFTNMENFQALGFAFNHSLQFTKRPKQLAIILHYRSKQEYQNEMAKKRVSKLRKVIKDYNLPIVVDVMEAFDN